MPVHDQSSMYLETLFGWHRAEVNFVSAFCITMLCKPLENFLQLLIVWLMQASLSESADNVPDLVFSYYTSQKSPARKQWFVTKSLSIVMIRS